MRYKINLRGITGTITVDLPKKPVETENGRQYEVYINEKDGTLDRIYRFDKINILGIVEIK